MRKTNHSLAQEWSMSAGAVSSLFGESSQLVFPKLSEEVPDILDG